MATNEQDLGLCDVPADHVVNTPLAASPNPELLEQIVTLYRKQSVRTDLGWFVYRNVWHLDCWIQLQDVIGACGIEPESREAWGYQAAALLPSIRLRGETVCPVCKEAAASCQIARIL